MHIEGSSALVTGGASGLGLATARQIVGRGGRVVIADLSEELGAKAVADLGDAARFVRADVTDETAVKAALDAASPLRFAVHCAGRGGDRTRILGKDGRPGDLTTFAEVVRINLIGTYNILRLAAARIAENDTLDDGDRGAIVLTASVAAFDGQIGQTSYSASKAGVHGLTLVAARDLASRQIRVNTIAPGIMDTPMLGRLRTDIREGLAASVPHPKRLGDPDDFARLAVEMLENPYLNGQTVRLDGAIRMAPR
ncbi:short-chain dehydrogenase/reductase SDR [Amycolatopsis mediterranei S699]|uniref:Short-chain dehydrogenase/reductase SDR n=2 Tax=Amycolatopsis mediterranei TaxID=33910 RepID=A0A0H3DDY4_AMYMU|nr:SDR family NAD(P)-dependent oxidoreductase [Amycolatopsis mediterranei]ADJ48911.1 short-chain dehydrogenase/reductase SDR [Amycolatopsis mediterranei U32]AEK45859.1 short-chain dehydrogenase/reductase SDR [Amycolatopsis mediterranei S699]AFO80619.1 short-chain dehydrogenase/reductase SDR [Amycolatopsis mediterranei S699]AGT87747.1 short-chain dehydrogenase/reductase SDR [Amycolatopsis mediterranei RB]KDU93972.1 3-hydroxy-2-methylbutyryl-CoA dehydrogenase [Amycolatopsis mediterranei]